MIRLEDIKARIEDRVDALAGRIEDAARFDVLMQAGQAPQNTPAAFILPGPIVGGRTQAMTGMFVQDFRETAIVALFVRATDNPRGDKAIAGLTPLARALVEAVAGWGPEDAVGVFVLDQAEFVGSSQGALVYELRFGIDDQLRIAA